MDPENRRQKPNELSNSPAEHPHRHNYKKLYQAPHFHHYMPIKPAAHKATFAAGCFWGVEEAFAKISGVISTQVGYIGGKTKHPTYKQVCTGNTGQAEAVEVTFEPTTITYQQLLDTFWNCHDPTTINRQGPDVGTQYRSAIFYHSEAQKKAAEKFKQQWQKKFTRPIVTEIVKASEFYRAEEYHQQYWKKHSRFACRI